MEFLIVLFALLGGWVSRMAGGGWPKLPWGLDQWIYAIPYAILCLLSAGSVALYLAVLTVFVLTVMFKRTGHGGWMDLGTWPHARTDEALEFIIKPLHGKISEYWYDFIGLVLVGAAVAVPGALFFALVDYRVSLLLLAGGAAKAIAYAIGWKIKKGGEATAVGEFLTGVFGWGSVAVSFMIL